jgi:CheY-like chemotaxis protein
MRLEHLLGGDSSTAVQRLRTLLLQTVEGLKPSPDLPTDPQVLRPYQVVYSRHILGNPLGTVEAELGLSARQIQREQQRAFSEIAARLWAAETDGRVDRGSPEQETLASEAARALQNAQAFDVSAEMRVAVESVSPMANARGLRVELRASESCATAVGDPAVFRQVLISALSYLIRLQQTFRVIAAAACDEKAIVCRFDAHSLATPSFEDCLASSAVQTLRTLAGTSGAEVAGPIIAAADLSQCSSGAVPSIVRIEIALPAVCTERVVAILEDNKDLVTLFARYLATHGIRLQDVGEPGGALELLADSVPDAIILDVMLSAADGWQILQAIRAHPHLRRVPVIVCSVLNESELAASLGANAYLKKPVRPLQILDCIQQVLTNRRSVGASRRSAAR